MRRLLSAALVLASTLALAPRVEAKPAFRLYRVQRGDSCWSIALKFWGKGEKYSEIHRYNRLGPLPHLLKEGQVLRLPLSAQNPDARIGWLRRDVRARAPYAVDWRRAKPEMGLWRLYKVTTGSASAAGIRFEDASKLRMRENALLVIYGPAGKQAKARRQIKTQLKVEEGTVVGGLARLDAARSLKVKTPSAQIELRSRQSQIEVDKRKTSIVSVHDGDADVSAKGAKVAVKAGYGTRVLRGKRPAPPRPLPRPPRWATQGAGLVPLPAGQKARFEARWASVKGARRYRVEVAKDKAFRFPVVVAVVGAGVRRLRARDLGPGDYFARVSAIDRWRLEGKPSAVRRWRVIPLSSSRRLEARPDGSYEAVGLLRLALPAAIGYEVSIDGGPFRRAAAVRLAKTGKHHVRYRLAGSTETSELKVHLLGVTALVAAPKRRLKLNEKVALRFSLRDERGRPAALPGLRLTFADKERKLLPGTAAGIYESTFAAPEAASGQGQLVLSWAAGELSRQTLQLSRPKAPPPPPKPTPPPPWRQPPPQAGAPTLSWGAPAGVALPSRDARPVTAIGLSSHIAGLERAEGADDATVLRLALNGQLALLDGRLGLDLEVPWYNGDLRVDEAASNDLGNIRFGARYVAWRAKGLALAPSLRVTLPSADLEGQWRAASFEPAAILAWRGLEDERLVLSTNLILPIQTDFERTRLFVAQTLGAAYRLWRGLSLGLELDWLVSLRDPADQERSAALLLGGQLSYEAERFRVALTGGGGLTEDARRELGSFNVGLNLELFLGSRR